MTKKQAGGDKESRARASTPEPKERKKEQLSSEAKDAGASNQQQNESPAEKPAAKGNSPSKLSKKYGALAVGAVLAVAAAYVYKDGGKQELMRNTRDTLLSLQSLRDYGPLGFAAFVMVFVFQLTLCIPGTMVVDVALGNIYGAVLGTLASVIAKTISALLSLFLGRYVGKAMGLEFPEMLRERMGAVKTHPLKALLLARLAPISTGVKNYALALLPSEDVPLGPYVVAVVLANLAVTTGVCILGAGADSLVDALDQASSHR
eukprot:TRINITY_DN19263_c0_g1_i1.p1 TRINITY_DN19263_c0_g1~~TRINITY_DN19263_c0_g1_i1.p1  ORF type:complete len:274 (-),score=53.97 TRINITY_DN19263_c0_g1_i1:129-914(-)